MQEEKISPGAGWREDLYIRTLLILTAVMIILVLTVFMSAGGGSWLFGRGTAVDTETSGENTGDSRTEDGSTSSDIPVVNPMPDYIPKTESSTKTMSDASLDAEYAILVDLGNNTVLASYRADKKIYPASMTKLMTLIVAAENIKDLNATFTITDDIIQRAFAAGASRAGFSAGEAVTMLDLLYGAAVPSGADATDALAISIAGSETEFVKLMNAKAASMGLTSTNFVNASGLHDDNHYSTVREMAAIMACAMDNPLVAQLISAKTYTTSPTVQHPGGITLYSTAFSRMSTYTFGKVTVSAAKTGFTDEARFCLATYGTAEDGKAYILVTAYGSDKYAPAFDCKYAYGTFVK